MILFQFAFIHYGSEIFTTGTLETPFDCNENNTTTTCKGLETTTPAINPEENNLTNWIDFDGRKVFLNLLVTMLSLYPGT